MRYLSLIVVALTGCAAMPNYSAYEACNEIAPEQFGSYGAFISSNDRPSYRVGSSPDRVRCAMGRSPDRIAESSRFTYWHYYDQYDYTGTTIVFRGDEVVDFYSDREM